MLEENSFDNIENCEKIAKKILNPKTWNYFMFSSGTGSTMKRNCVAFQKYLLRPKLMRNVETRQLSTTILGEKIDFPICLAPTVCFDPCRTDVEVCKAQAAFDMNTCVAVSVWANTGISELTTAVPSGLKWLQTHPFYEREHTVKPMIKKAEEEGYKAIVLTIDSRVLGPDFGIRMRNGDFQLGPLSSLPNFKDLPEPEKGYHDPSATWEFMQWLKTTTNLPIVVKGILTAEGATEAVNNGASALIVSNHGGRQLDGAPASIDCLSEVVQAVDGRCEVYLDSGIRSGTDVFKAIAMGARAVFVGRPILWGQACGGTEGIKKVLQILRDDLSTTMGLCGCESIEDITPSLVRTESKYGQL